MRLVDYSSSEESEDEILSVTEQQATRTISGASLPALPSGFYDLYSGISCVVYHLTSSETSCWR